ncbi:uncharacterized protein LOC141900551 [Tubulanus polymorphus]|uniref:uncharacterized protein LOC141900551 n=1 Tax=Tubulanus polymorphus TaxID=672921 RepID=UPI003DA41716
MQKLVVALVFLGLVVLELVLPAIADGQAQSDDMDKRGWGKRGWGKRNGEDENYDQLEEALKRGWGKRGWGKRGWGKRGWGKRDECDGDNDEAIYHIYKAIQSEARRITLCAGASGTDTQ